MGKLSEDDKKNVIHQWNKNVIVSGQSKYNISQINLPISALADNLHLKVIDATGCRDGVGSTHRRSILMVLPMAWGTQEKGEKG